MLKRRIIATLLIRNGVCVQSRRFGGHQPIGRPSVAVSHLNTWGVDEIICLHLDHAGCMDADPSAAVRDYARNGLVPLAVGGGLGSVEHMRRVLHSGADKVVVNTLLHAAPREISRAAALFGRQSLVACIDVRRTDGGWRVYTHGGATAAALSFEETLAMAQDHGAGEIMLHSIDRDGTGTGYDMELLEHTAGRIGVPVILSGGYGVPGHMIAALRSGASAVTAGNALHYTEHSICLIKAFLHEAGVPIRHDLPLRYAPQQAGETGRCAKHDEDTLLRMRFQAIEPTVI